MREEFRCVSSIPSPSCETSPARRPFTRRGWVFGVEDFGNFVLFETGFAIHEGPALERTVWRQASATQEPYGRANLLLYFEHEDVDAAFSAIAPHVTLIHPVEEQAWGQRVFRFYDPDGHAVEVGEPQRKGDTA